MVIFIQLIRGGASRLLLYFLLCSRFVPEKLPRDQQILCFGGCCALLCLGGHWVIQLTAAVMAAVSMVHFMGQTKPMETALFAALFTALYAAAWLGGQWLAYAVNSVLLHLTVLYLLVLCAAALGKRWRTVAPKLLPLVLPLLIQALLCSVCIHQAQRIGVAMVQFFACLWSLYSAVMLLPTAKRAEQDLRSQEEKHQAARQYAMQEEYYQQLLEKQNQTRALWHDLNKYLRAAKAETAPSEALARLQAMLDDATAIVDVGNPVVNVILNEYAQSAKALGIELRLKVQVPETLFVSAADLYVLMGNTMDNAMEACRFLPQHQRLIELTLRTHHDVLYYRLTNPYDGTVKHPVSSMRGHGLENARRCVAQYDGQLLTQLDQGFFIVSAHMNQLSQN